MSRIYFRKRPVSGAQPEIFQGRWGFVKLGHSDKHFIINSRKTAPQGKILEFGKFNLRMDTIRAFFSKIRALFLIFKKGQETPLEIFYRPEWTKGGNTWKLILAIFKYKNECYKQSGKSRWKKWCYLSSFHISFWSYGH